MNDMLENTTEKTMPAFNNDSHTIENNKSPEPKKKKTALIVTVLVSVAIIAALAVTFFVLFFNNEDKPVSDRELAEAKSDYIPPAEIIKINKDLSDPSNDEISFNYDSRSRILSCSYTANSKQYNQQYSYNDTEKKITIRTKYKTYVILTDEIEYKRIPSADIFCDVDGYYVRLDKESLGIDDLTEKETENETEKVEPETELPATIDYDNLVTTEREMEYDNGITFRIPRINLDSPAAKQLNSNIVENTKYVFLYSDGYVQCDYEYFVNNNILSVIVSTQGNGGGYVSYQFYSLDLNTGYAVSDNEIKGIFSISDDEIYKKIREAEELHFEEVYSNLGSGQQRENLLRTYNDSYSCTMEESNLRDFSICVGSKGLIACITEYTFAGQGNTKVIIDLENLIVYRYFTDFQEEY